MTPEQAFFIRASQRRIQRAKLALVWAERAFLISGSQDDLATLVDCVENAANYASRTTVDLTEQ